MQRELSSGERDDDERAGSLLREARLLKKETRTFIPPCFIAKEVAFMIFIGTLS